MARRLDELAPDIARTERLKLFQRLCEAVAFAHAHGVVHRDLKPENVMVGPFGEVLVMDWGVATALDRDGRADTEGASPAPRATAAGSVVGTLDYMAPEQAAGETGGTGTAADVYALGGILHFLLTGHAPFEGDAAEARARGDAPSPAPPAARDRPERPAGPRGHRAARHGGRTGGPLSIGRRALGRSRPLPRRRSRARAPREPRSSGGVGSSRVTGRRSFSWRRIWQCGSPSFSTDGDSPSPPGRDRPSPQKEFPVTL